MTTQKLFSFVLLPLGLVAVPTVSSQPGTSAPRQTLEKPLRVRFGPGPEPSTLNPLTLEGQDALPVHNVALESLLVPDPETYQWKSALAESWFFTPDDRAIEFTLRENARWCDGRPVTAEDVRFTYDAIFDAKYPMAFLRPFYSTFSGVEVLDARRVRFHLKHAYFGNIIQSASLKILPAHIYRDHSERARLNERLCGSGPYYVDRWTRGRSITMRQNKYWWGRADQAWKDRHRSKRLAFVFVNDDARALDMMERAELDFAEIGSETYTRQRATRRKSTNYEYEEVRNAAPVGASQITLNLRDPLFADARVRRALNLMVDRRAMIEHLYDGLATETTGPWYRQSPFADESVAEPGHDPARALALLREAGWRDDGTDEFLTREIDGRRRRLEFTVLAAADRDVRLLTMVKEDAARIGVDVHIRRLDQNAMYRTLVARDFQAAITTERARYVDFDPRSQYWSRGAANFAGLDNAAVNELVEKVSVSRDFDQRRNLMRDLFDRVVDELPAVYLLNDVGTYYAVAKRVVRPKTQTNYDSALDLMYVRPEPKR